MISGAPFSRGDPTLPGGLLNLSGAYDWAVDNPSRHSRVEGLLRVRLSNRFSVSGRTAYEIIADTLQYAATATTDDAPGGP